MSTKQEKKFWWNSIWFTILTIALFGIGFGLVEAAVVIHLRALFDINTLTPVVTGEDIAFYLPFFALLKPKAFLNIFPDPKVVNLELYREAATMLMLICVAFLAGKNWKQRLGAWLFVFAVWDILYYVFLKVFINWPKTISDPDVLFLIPLPWVAPVWLPVAVSFTWIIIGTYLFWRFQDQKVSREGRRRIR